MLPAPDPTQRMDEVCEYKSKVAPFILLLGWAFVTGLFFPRAMWWYWIAWMFIVWMAALLIHGALTEAHNRKCGKVHRRGRDR